GSGSNTGVQGVGGLSGGIGVEGQSPGGNTGVYGVSAGASGQPPTYAGVVGDSNSNSGVCGFTSKQTRAAGEFNHLGDGIGGQGTSRGGNTGVYGLSAGASGQPPTFAGVVGESDTNAGVAGFTSAPARAAGEFRHTAGGIALDVQGPAQFAR